MTAGNRLPVDGSGNGNGTGHTLVAVLDRKTEEPKPMTTDNGGETGSAVSSTEPSDPFASQHDWLNKLHRLNEATPVQGVEDLILEAKAAFNDAIHFDSTEEGFARLRERGINLMNRAAFVFYIMAVQVVMKQAKTKIQSLPDGLTKGRLEDRRVGYAGRLKSWSGRQVEPREFSAVTTALKQIHGDVVRLIEEANRAPVVASADLVINFDEDALAPIAGSNAGITIASSKPATLAVELKALTKAQEKANAVAARKGKPQRFKPDHTPMPGNNLGDKLRAAGITSESGATPDKQAGRNTQPQSAPSGPVSPKVLEQIAAHKAKLESRPPYVLAYWIVESLNHKGGDKYLTAYPVEDRPEKAEKTVKDFIAVAGRFEAVGNHAGASSVLFRLDKALENLDRISAAKAGATDEAKRIHLEAKIAPFDALTNCRVIKTGTNELRLVEAGEEGTPIKDFVAELRQALGDKKFSEVSANVFQLEVAFRRFTSTDDKGGATPAQDGTQPSDTFKLDDIRPSGLIRGRPQVGDSGKTKRKSNKSTAADIGAELALLKGAGKDVEKFSDRLGALKLANEQSDSNDKASTVEADLNKLKADISAAFSQDIAAIKAAEEEKSRKAKAKEKADAEKKKEAKKKAKGQHKG